MPAISLEDTMTFPLSRKIFVGAFAEKMIATGARAQAAALEAVSSMGAEGIRVLQS